MIAFNKCSQTEHETLSGAQAILEQFHQDHSHMWVLVWSDLLWRHSKGLLFVRTVPELSWSNVLTNASVLAGHSTIQCEKYLCETLGITLLMRDYSEIQCGKSVCDRLSGSAKLRMRAYVNAGHDLVNATDIKKGIRIVLLRLEYSPFKRW